MLLKQADKLSLPNVTYGFDILCHIANRRNEDKKQFKEIWEELVQEENVEISEREVGRLYRKMEALLMGNQVMIREKLTRTVEEYGQLIIEVDGLQPDGNGPKLYVLHELLGGTVLSVAQLDQANTERLTEWLKPYQEWSHMVKATLSDNEKALVAALGIVFPQAKHQLCQMHFVKNLSEPVHKADRALQKEIREAMGNLPPVPVPTEEPAKDSSPPVSQFSDDENPGNSLPAPISSAVMQAIDIVSGVTLATLDSVAPQKWESLLTAEDVERVDEDVESADENVESADKETANVISEGTETTPTCEQQTTTETTSYLSVTESKAWLENNLLAQIPASAQPLVVAVPDKASITCLEHIRYRQAIQDARWLGSRKPFLCGGLRSYEQLHAIDQHLTTRQAQQGLDPYLSSLHTSVQRAVMKTAPLAADVAEAKQWVVRVERLLDSEPPTDESRLPSAVQRQLMDELLAECQELDSDNVVIRDLQSTWSRTLKRWEDDLYHCYDINALPRSNLGIEALFGHARRQQRRLNGQADTSDLSVTGQGYLRVNSTGQEALMEMVCQVPAWVYRFSSRCLEAVEDGVRWPRLLHRNTTKALEQFHGQLELLRQRANATLEFS